MLVYPYFDIISDTMIHKEIGQKVQEALRERDELKLSVLRGLLSAFTNELVSKNRKPNEELSDEDVLSVIKREANKRKDSIEQFTKGNRPELAEAEEKELKILEEYLPEQMSEEEIQKIVLDKKEELGVSDKSKMGMLIGAVMKEVGNQADGSVVKSIAEKSLD